jgi:hypothetical protein
MRRDEVWLINSEPTVGAEIKKTRPVVIVNHDAIGILPLDETSIRILEIYAIFTLFTPHLW